MQNYNEDSTVKEEKIIPASIDEWERTLVHYFLTIGEYGDASDIYSLEISRRTLALACGVAPAYEVDVEAAFKKALIQDPHLLESLRVGSQRLSSLELPNFFAPLAMTVFIDILLDHESNLGNQFRVKLADWLGLDKTFSDLSGVALMWEELRKWLSSRIAEGASFRRLVLPDPKSWKHIGYTRRLSFPNKSDIRVVEQVLQRVLQNHPITPPRVLNAFDQIILGNSISLGLKEAFKDFRYSYYSDRRAIADHRFWALITQVGHRLQPETKNEISLDMIFTEDDEQEFRVISSNGAQRSFVNFVEAIQDYQVQSSSELGLTLRKGIVFFRQTGYAVWRAESNIERCNDRVYVGFKKSHLRLFEKQITHLRKDKDWYISSSSLDIRNILSVLKNFFDVANYHNEVFSPRVYEGIRVHGTKAWLGLPDFLPRIECDTKKINIDADKTASEILIAELKEEGMILSAATCLNGTYYISPSLHGSEKNIPWRLSVKFVERATPHLMLDNARQKLPLLHDCQDSEEISITCRLPDELAWKQVNKNLDWLLEAIYASGASGWDEADLISLISRSNSDLAENPWRTLRLLQDGRVIEPRLRAHWRGRVWTLVQPMIIAANNGSVDVAIIEGAMCTYMLENFRNTVKGLSGSEFRISDMATWAIPIVGAVGIQPQLLAEKLGWKFVKKMSSVNPRTLSLNQTKRQGENYVVARTWCWKLRRFVKYAESEGAVRLTQRVHQKGTDHDVYRLEKSGNIKHYLSRNAAIVAAHMEAKIPLFEFKENRLELLAKEGALPDLVAIMLRANRLQAADFNKSCYFYSATMKDVAWLSSLLPGCIKNSSTEISINRHMLISKTRRYKGKERAKWENSQLIL